MKVMVGSTKRPVCTVLALLSGITLLVCARLEILLKKPLPRPPLLMTPAMAITSAPGLASLELPTTPALRTIAEPAMQPLGGTFVAEDLAAQDAWTTGRHLIVSYYEGNYSTARQEEVQQVLLENVGNEHITKIHLLLEGVPLNNSFVAQLLVRWPDRLVPVRLAQHGQQPTYKDLFGYANRVLGRGAVGIISNADIVLDETIACAREVSPANKVVFNQTEKRVILALSRHPAPCGAESGESSECARYRGSHDTFIFAPPLSEAAIRRLDFVQNRLGAENRLLYEFRTEGYRLANPCRVIRGTHRHCVQHSRMVPKKRLARRGDGKYASVDPISRFKCGDVIY